MNENKTGEMRMLSSAVVCCCCFPGAFLPAGRLLSRTGRPACKGKGMLLSAATWHQCNEWELNASNADNQLNCLLLPFSPSQEGSRLFLKLGPRYVTIPNAFSHVKEHGKCYSISCSSHGPSMETFSPPPTHLLQRSSEPPVLLKVTLGVLN